MNHLRCLLSRLRSIAPIITTRAQQTAVNRRLFALEERHFLDQQTVALRDRTNRNLTDQVETLRELYAGAVKDCKALADQRDHALAEVADLRADNGRHREAMRFWIERTTEPHICHN